MRMALIRQRIYLWRKFRGITTKRALAKALRARLANMSRAEEYCYWDNPSEAGFRRQERLEQRHLRERRMVVAILGYMYHKVSRVPYGSEWKQTTFYRRYK